MGLKSEPSSADGSVEDGAMKSARQAAWLTWESSSPLSSDECRNTCLQNLTGYTVVRYPFLKAV